MVRKKKPANPIVGLVCIAIIVMLFGAGIYARTRHKTPVVSSAISTVLISDERGHGSGVHIGSGFILTAAHVADGHDKMTVTDSNGNAQTGTVLWLNKAYDVALIQIDNPSGIASSKLACGNVLHIGDKIEAVGSPITLQFIHTYGRISAVEANREMWKLSVIADISVGPGMSGGPVFDVHGDVVGLAVGISMMPMGFVGAPYGVSYIVPSSAVCLLLAEARR